MTFYTSIVPIKTLVGNDCLSKIAMIKFKGLFFKMYGSPTQCHYSSAERVALGRRNKRGSMLTNMLVNRDKNKKWHLNFLEQAPRAKSLFKHVHRPSKRQNMLNSLFIKNITDVLSTGEISPEIAGCGVEINGVKVSPCYKSLNVYWQIPSTSYDRHEEIALALNACAPALRAELISRNVMGRVPYIFFVRDITNARIAAFENALRDADLGPEDKRNVIPDDEFTKDVMVFRKKKKPAEKEIFQSHVSSDAPPLPQRPPGMKCDVYGLRHDVIMDKVIASRGRTKLPEHSAVISSEYFPSAELFDKIPGTPLQGPGVDRSKLLKQFQLQRKMEKERKTNFKITKSDSTLDDEEDDSNDWLEDLDLDNFIDEPPSKRNH